MSTQQLYAAYKEKMQRIADVKNALAVLQWDQETYLPANGARFRGQQISTLSEIAHKMFSDDMLGNILKELSEKEDLSAGEKRNVTRTLEDYTRNRKYSSSFVRRLSEQTNRAFHSWIDARRQNKFSAYEPDLDTLVALKKEETEILGYEQHPYNALLDEFEKGATVRLIDKTFENLLPQLKALMDRILVKPQVDDSFLQQHFPAQQQWHWGMELVKLLHFNFDSGRQDKSEHPFSISFNRNDVRITTRISEQDFANMTWSCIHETGHALYEQGLPEEQYGLPLGEACSYSIHESQSRLWENNVGRSLRFWQHFFPQLQGFFPEQFRNTTVDQFYKGINKVQPSLIRTEADEISYHFHVAIRYELEKGLLAGTLATSGIPEFWNDRYRHFLGVSVPDDKSGCLQDVHWSHGSFGYFPTYSLGSFYAAQLYRHAAGTEPGLEPAIGNGNLLPLLQWLRQHVHNQGRFHTSEDLCRAITGKPLEVRYFQEYILEKYSGIYNL